MLTSLLIVVIVIQAAIITRLLWDNTYHCWKRELLNLLQPVLKMSGYTFVFADLDRFGQVDARIGYEGANRLVRTSLRSFWRSGDLALVFRYFSGDEFLVAVHGDQNAAHKVAERLQAAFNAHELSATFGISNQVEQAISLVQEAKPKIGPRPLEGQILVV